MLASLGLATTRARAPRVLRGVPAQRHSAVLAGAAVALAVTGSIMDTIGEDLAEQLNKTKAKAAEVTLAKTTVATDSGSTSNSMIHMGLGGPGTIGASSPNGILGLSPFVAGVLGVNTIVFAAWQLARSRQRVAVFMNRHFVSSLDNWYAGRLHTVITSGFSHESFMHFLFNNIAFWSFATSLERFRLPAWMLPTFYGGGLFGCSMLSMLNRRYYSPASKHVGSLGSSGGVAALVTVSCMLRPEAQLSIIFLPFLPFFAGTFFPLWLAAELTGLVTRSNFMSIDFAGHVGGIMAGLVAYTFGLRPISKRPDLHLPAFWRRRLEKYAKQ